MVEMVVLQGVSIVFEISESYFMEDTWNQNSFWDMQTFFEYIYLFQKSIFWMKHPVETPLSLYSSNMQSWWSKKLFTEQKTIDTVLLDVANKYFKLEFE